MESGVDPPQTVAVKHNGHLPLRRFVIPPKLPPPVQPALLEHAQERARDVQNRIADQITRFAGSMTFVYLHIIWFGCRIGFGAESYPFGLLTMIVSLEAILLSTFVYGETPSRDGVVRSRRRPASGRRPG